MLAKHTKWKEHLLKKLAFHFAWNYFTSASDVLCAVADRDQQQRTGQLVTKTMNIGEEPLY
jgi:hypothetical protein